MEIATDGNSGDDLFGDLVALGPNDVKPKTVPEQYELEDELEATVDSGASHSVANRRHFPGADVRPSDFSRRGIKYGGAGKEVIPNEGEVQECLMTSEGVVSNSTWQIANVRKPLMAVSQCNDKKNMVIFDNDLSCILSNSAPETEQIRALLRRASKKIQITRQGGTYKLKLWRIPRAAMEMSKGFHRLGRGA